ncbi:DUF3329 domain-containing protein [Butyrivibrio sp. MC2013]|uniref:DUF3329 domain-containing protein n=1 Tax=Butyrivibrio sp. MC2013 TaxID=1280686 RepID=UPI000404CB01|nr:DUF6056 family protein [Butyrivibrio sp. MC2013]
MKVRTENMDNKALQRGRANKHDVRFTAVAVIALISFVFILMFNFFTPLISDDMSYGSQVREAKSVLDLFKQEYQQYMTWNSRTVTFIFFRFMLCLPQWIFKIINSCMFMLLSFLVYMNVRRRDRWDPFVMLLVQLGLWIFSVNMAQTMLWMAGTMTYLWGAVIILGFMTWMRDLLAADRKASLPLIIGAFFFGWAAGWCNENTSGAAALFLIILYGYRKWSKRVIPAYHYSAFAGNVVGLAFMVLSPGARLRGSFAEENYSGLAKYIARFQKLTLYNRDEFLILLAIFAATVLWTVMYIYRREGHLELTRLVIALRNRLTFFALYFATLYVLIATALPQVRAIFGAGIFLLIACIQGLSDNLREAENYEDSCALMKESVGEKVSGEVLEKALGSMLTFIYAVCAAALSIYLIFDLIDCGVMLMRIRRDYDERVAYILEQKAAGSDDITVAQFHPDFDNHYSCAYEMELTDDPDFWINVQYEDYFGVDSIRAIPYEEWEAVYKDQ